MNKTSQTQWRVILLMTALLAMFLGYASTRQSSVRDSSTVGKAKALEQKGSAKPLDKIHADAETETYQKIIAFTLTLMQQKINGSKELKFQTRKIGRHKSHRTLKVIIDLKDTTKLAHLNSTASKTAPEKGWYRSQSRYG